MGWKYVSCNIWNKGISHIAGNVNTQKIKHFPKVTEVCVQYIKIPILNGLEVNEWLISEWKKTRLPLRKANEACGVADAATRKYFARNNLFYPPPSDKFEKLVSYANKHGDKKAKPFFSINKKKSLSKKEWEKLFPYFSCPIGVTNVWDRKTLKGSERITALNGKVSHLNQKPEDLTELILKSSTKKNQVVWEPFGGLFTASYVSNKLGFKSFGAEIDKEYFILGLRRLKS